MCCPVGSNNWCHAVGLPLGAGDLGSEVVGGVPQAAVQSSGSRTVVYVAVEEEGRFVETPVTLGSVMGDVGQVLGGIKLGDKVVTEGTSSWRRGRRVRSSG